MPARIETPEADGCLMTLAEVAQYLKVAEKTVLRMLKRGEIPAVKVSSQWRFARAAIQDWLMTGMRTTAVEMLDELRPHGPVPLPLSRLLPDGAILTGLGPEPKEAVLARLVAPLVAQGVVADGPAYLAQVLAREQMVATAVGGGLALPHARDPAARPGSAGLVVGISPAGIPFGAPDGQPVRIFVVVCADSVARHLELMAQVALALRDASVVQGLREACAPRDVLAALVEHEQRQLFGKLTGVVSGAEERGSICN